MNCPKCGHAQADGSTECESCQVIFAKLLKPVQAQSSALQQPPAPQEAEATPPPATAAGVLKLLFQIFMYACLILLMILAYAYPKYKKWQNDEFHRLRTEKANREAQPAFRIR